MPVPDLTAYTEADLTALIDAARLRQSEIDRATRTNEQLLRDSAAVDAEIAAVMTHADRMTTEVEMAVKWVAEALYQVGALSIRAARLAAGRTQTAETRPGV